MQQYSARTKSYMAVVLAGAIAIALLSFVGFSFTMEHVIPFAGLTVLAAIAHLYPLRAAKDGGFYVVATVFIFAAILLLPLPYLMLHCILIMLPVTILNRDKPRVWLRWSFNTAQTLVAAAAAKTLLEAAAWSGMGSLLAVLQIATAAVIFALLQGLAVSLAIHFNTNTRLLDAEPLKPAELATEVVMALLGAMSAVLWVVEPWSLVLLPIPVLLTYFLMRRVLMIRMADLDPKTGIYNYRYFEQALQKEFARCVSVKRPMSVIFFDLDLLRHINNKYGHLAGDQVLMDVARVLEQNIRPDDVAARFGGEEFVIMLPGTERQEAAYVAERLRRLVERHETPVDGQIIRVTISAGVASYPVHADESADRLLRKADEALYLAKSQGRNRVRLAEASPDKHVVAIEAVAGHRASAPATAPAPVAAPARPVGEVRGPVRFPNSPAPAGRTEPAARPAPARKDPRIRIREAARWFSRALPWVVGVSGALTLVVAYLGFDGSIAKPIAFGLLAATTILAEILKVQVFEDKRQRMSVTLSQGVILAGVASLQPLGALLVGLSGGVTHALLNRKASAEKISFNLGNLAFSTFVASMVYMEVAPPLSDGVVIGHLLAPGLASLAFFLTNIGLLSLMIALRTERTLLAVFSDNLWIGPAFVFLGLTGGFLGAAFHILGWIGVVVCLTPIFILRFSYMHTATKTHQYIAELERAKHEVELAHEKQVRTLDQLIVTVSSIIDARDRATYGHSQQVANYAVALAEELGIAPADVQRIRIAALLHDLGKVGIPEAILQKPAKLTPEEYEIVKQHSDIGGQILAETEELTDVAQMVREHHEFFNGKGYPSGKAGEEITIGARIIAVADTLDSIISDRPYSRARPLPVALEEFQRCTGSQFDPQVVDALMRLADLRESSFFINSARPEQQESFRQLTAAGGA